MSFQTILTIADMHRLIQKWREQQLRVAFVPTMGALHEGHISLVQKATELADRVVVSIFVNPLQFGPSEDFSRYPRTFSDDVKKLEGQKTDAIFAPSAVEMYPNGFQTAVINRDMSKVLCGSIRPGHFEGVLTVVAKLFHIVQPDFAMFGKKDFQQFRLIERMVTDLCLPVEVIGVETKREADGLAMSSRNRYLSEEQRSKSTLIFKGLSTAKASFESGIKDKAQLIARFVETIAVVQEMKIQYAEILRSQDLSNPGEQLVDGPFVFAAAVLYGDVRLIDNVEFGV